MSQMPTWEEFMIPVLRNLSDGEVRALRDLISEVSKAQGLSPEQLAAVLGSGQRVVANRIGWAVSYLTRVGVLERPQKGQYSLTSFGREFLAKHPRHITESDLREIAKPGDEWWTNKGKNRIGEPKDSEAPEQAPNTLDPLEMIDRGIEQIHGDVKSQLIEKLVAKEPAFFEQAVVKLLVAMGYGGTGGQAAATSLVNDGGIDGVIDQDVLGLSKVYIQAKRYTPENAVHRPEVQAFVGALSGKADQGVFITTGRFSSGAREYAERDARVRIILIDGAQLVELMVRYRVGVQVRLTVDIVAVDEDFFE